MRYKYVKVIHSTICDENIEDEDSKVELIKKIISSKFKCSIKYHVSGIERSYKKIKISELKDGKIHFLAQTKSGSFKTKINLSDLSFLEINSFEDSVVPEDDSNRYDFLDC